MVTSQTINRLELLQIAKAVAGEKMISTDIILEALEEAIQKMTRTRYGADYDIRVNIHRLTGDISIHRYRLVVEEVEDANFQITLEDARRTKSDIALGDYLIEALPPIDFGRISAQSTKQLIVQKVREAERDRQYDDFKDRIGQVVIGKVRRVEFGNLYIDLGGRGEGILRRDDLILREVIKVDDRVRCYVSDVRREAKGPQIFLSRTHPQFMAKLFAMEVPEIYDGIVEIKGVSRDPGSRAKITVFSHDASIDPVGACVGLRGSRVQAITTELQGEKVDIIEWTEDVPSLVVNALAPARVNKVVVDEEMKRVDVVVEEDQLSLAIGRRGQNVRLASMLINWGIDIMTETEHSERRSADFVKKTDLFVEALNVDELIAQLLASEGFNTVEEVAYVDPEDLKEIEGFDDETVQALQERAIEFLETQKQQKMKKEVAGSSLLALDITPEQILDLKTQNIVSLDDFAGLTPVELVGGEEDGEVEEGFETFADLSLTEASDLIMKARGLSGLLS